MRRFPPDASNPGYRRHSTFVTPFQEKPRVSPLSHEQFMRLFLQSEREILRYVMAIVPNVADARDILQEMALALWKAIDCGRGDLPSVVDWRTFLPVDFYVSPS